MLETSFSRQPGLLQMWFFFNPAAGTPQNTICQHWNRGGRGFANDGLQKPKLAFVGGSFEMVLFKSPHGPDGDPENKHYWHTNRSHFFQDCFLVIFLWTSTLNLGGKGGPKEFLVTVNIDHGWLFVSWSHEDSGDHSAAAAKSCSATETRSSF